MECVFKLHRHHVSSFFMRAQEEVSVWTRTYKWWSKHPVIFFFFFCGVQVYTEALVESAKWSRDNIDSCSGWKQACIRLWYLRAYKNTKRKTYNVHSLIYRKVETFERSSTRHVCTLNPAKPVNVKFGMQQCCRKHFKLM